MITHVPREKLDDHWDQVKDALDRVINKGASAWKIEHVYVLLFTGQAHLMIDDNGGAAVWMRYQTEDGKGMMFVLAGSGNFLGNRSEVYDEMTRVAKIANCNKIRMISPRKGWQKDQFWRMTGYVYEHEVT